MTFRLRHLLAALILHGALAILLVTGVQCSRVPERPVIIRAVLLDPNRLQVAQQKKEQQAEAQRRQEQQRRQQQEEQRQEQIQQQKLAEEQKRRQQAAELQRKQKEIADRKKAEELRKRQEQEEAKERQQQAQLELQEKARIEDEMRSETAQLKARQQQEAQAATERQRKQGEWAVVLEDHIRKYWNRPASAPEVFACTVHVQLLPDGSVTRAQISKSCGNSQLDRSVEDAALRASPLPKPSDPSVFDRDLIINFEP